MRNRAKLALVLVYAYGHALLPACVPNPDRRDEDAGTATCASACAAATGCPGWRGTPGVDEQPGTADDQSCEDVCEDVQREAVDAPAIGLPLKCVSAARTCDEVAACEE